MNNLKYGQDYVTRKEIGADGNSVGYFDPKTGQRLDPSITTQIQKQAQDRLTAQQNANDAWRQVNNASAIPTGPREPTVFWDFENNRAEYIAPAGTQLSEKQAGEQLLLGAGFVRGQNDVWSNARAEQLVGNNLGGVSRAVYGPDGQMYSSPTAALAAGVFNYSSIPPASGLISSQNQQLLNTPNSAT
jgi:hypothetical protein